MKRLFVILAAVCMAASVWASEKLIDHAYTTYEYRWGNSKNDSHSVKTYGPSSIIIDEELNAVVVVTCPQKLSSFTLTNDMLIDFQKSYYGFEIVYRYGNGEVHITKNNNQVLVAYIYGEKFHIWALH